MIEESNQAIFFNILRMHQFKIKYVQFLLISSVNNRTC